MDELDRDILDLLREDGRMPANVLETVMWLDPASGEELAADDLEPMRDWLAQWETEPIVEQVVYRG